MFFSNLLIFFPREKKIKLFYNLILLKIVQISNTSMDLNIFVNYGNLNPYWDASLPVRTYLKLWQNICNVQARIKKIMQSDEEVGKVAAPVPVIISRYTT